MTKSRTVVLRGALLTGTCVAACVATAGSASAAAPSCSGTKATIAGQGSTLQNTAQSIWANGPTTVTPADQFNTSSQGCSNVTVNYNKLAAPNNITGSQGALKAWGADGSTTFNTNLNYLGTDDAPTPTQISNIDAKASTSGTTKSVVAPITQTAVAVIANPPSGCTLNNITQANLEKAFSGAALTWAAIGGSGSGCSGTITRVVRHDGSGTTNNFEQYLNTARTSATSAGGAGLAAAVPCTPSSQSWDDLRKLSPNTTWPVNGSGGCAAGTLSNLTMSTSDGGGALATLVDSSANNGDIGYAALPDAEQHLTNAHLLNVRAGTGTSFRSPVTSTGSNADCASASYSNLPTASVDADWSNTYGNSLNPASGYGLCALTYNMSLTNNAAAFGATDGPGIAASVKKFLTYAGSTTGTDGGQGALTGHFYSALPSAVKTASDNAVAQIG